MPLRLLDTRVLLQVDTPDVVAAAGRLLAPFVEEDPVEHRDRKCLALVDGDHTGIAERAGMRLAYRDGKVIGSGDNWADPFNSMMAVLNRQVIEEYTGYAVHAGVVAAGGNAIAFPADSGGGKSTLTAACIQAGLDYVSDESLCIDMETARVVSYPKPLGLSRWSRTRLGLDGARLAFPPASAEAMATPADLGGSTASGPIGLAHVVIATYGTGPLALKEVPGHVAMAALLEFSFNHYKHGERAFKLAAELANRATVWRLDYDDVAAAARLIKSRLA